MHYFKNEKFMIKINQNLILAFKKVKILVEYVFFYFFAKNNYFLLMILVLGNAF